MDKEPVSDAGTLRVDPAQLASTYPPDQLLTALYLENLHLKKQYVPPFETSDVVPPTPEEMRTGETFAALRDYLARDERPGPRFLVVANDYPDVGTEYGNGFIHRRVKAYQAMGATVDVVAFGRRRDRRVYEYDGVTVLSGYGYELSGLLASRTYESVSVHFLNPTMWNVLYPARHSTRFVFFLHGYEVDRWIRRDFEHRDAENLRLAISRSLGLQAFWRTVTQDLELQAHFVFVSDWWRRLVEEDMEIVVPGRRRSIVHNVIDTDLFRFRQKPAGYARKLLWIRSAHSAKYGADLAVRCLEELRRGRDWNRYEVRIIGDGQHFGLFESAFGDDPRVTIERRFAAQTEIAELHQQYGVMLIPTRYDSQGVSRDEAMSSGLVPVTNAVAAVPEFVDDTCAVLAPPEDATAMARGIQRLVAEPAAYEAMSAAAGRRAREQCGPAATVAREAELLGMLPGEALPW